MHINLLYVTIHRCQRDYCDAAEIMSIADAMEFNGMRDLGYTYINLDGKLFKYMNYESHVLSHLTDCWADHRDEDGNIVPDSNRFPKYVHISYTIILFKL